MSTGVDHETETLWARTARRWPAARIIPEHAGATVTEDPAAPVDRDRLVADWRLLCGDLPDTAATAERLRLLGIDIAALGDILVAESSPAEPSDPVPPWIGDLRRWYARGFGTRERLVRFEGDAGLLTALLPLLQGAVDELEEGVADRIARSGSEALGDLPHVLSALTRSAPLEPVGGLVLRTMVLELNVARVEGRLSGETPADRFASYVSLLTDPEVVDALWAEYPVLARLVVQRVRYWVDTRLELLDHLLTDLPDLAAGILGRDHGVLTSVEMDAGDGHRQGRSVAIVRFERGRIVYKPRSLAIDAAFDRLLGWLNDSRLQPGFRRLVSLDRGSHGWVEHIDTEATTDSAGADRYAYKLGVLSAVLYALNATDFHLENVMAEGGEPVLVDLESVVHVELAGPQQTDPLVGPADRALAASIYATGLIPSKILVNDDTGSVAWDFSAVGGRGGQLSPFAVGAFDDMFTDTMHFAPRRIEMKQESNQPRSADGEFFDVGTRHRQFADGFEDAYRLVLDRAEELCAPGGPIDGFADIEARHIARATNIYARLLNDATHPDFLRRGTDRERVLCRLMRGLPGVPFRESMYADEVAELRRGDIPVFAVHLGSGVVRGGDADQFIGVMDSPPLDAVRARIRGLGSSDLRLQSRIIELAFASVSMSGDRLGVEGRRRPSARAAVDPGEFADAAGRLAHRLVDSAVREGPDVGWIGLRLMDDRHWILSGTEFDLYSGTSGIALGLDAVAAVTGDPVVDEVALTVFDQIGRLIRLQDAEKLQDGITPTSALDIGAMGPLAGVVHALAIASLRRRDPAIAAPAELLLPVLAAAIADDGFFDVVAGSAGTLLALLALAEARPGCGALETASLAGRHLVDRQLRGPSGGGWPGKLSTAPLAGLSHGASGIALALARLHAVRPDPALLTAIAAAVRYERSLFDPAVRNWRDVRELNENQDAGMVTWCHGAGGIAAVRASLLRLGVPDPDGTLETDRSAAVRTIAEAGLFTDGRRGIGNHSLCHGDLGNLLMIEQSLTERDEPAFRDAVPATWAAILRDAGENGWLAGVPTGVEVPGLMCGTAGMAWALARKAAPTQIADVLTLAARPAEV